MSEDAKLAETNPHAFVMNRRGYLVIGHEEKLRPGQPVRSLKYGKATTQPIFVIAETTREDMDEQSRLFDEIGYEDSWFRPYEYYYRVSTD
jgi:hypothetical protein